ncbi:hypothetical protein D3C87_1765090 [compost metagenome]
MRGLLVGPQEQQIDVGERRQGAPAVAADGQQAQALALGWIAGPEHVDGGEVVEGGDHLVGDAAEQAGRLQAAGPVL